MSNFFNKSDLTRQDADKLVSETLNNSLSFLDVSFSASELLVISIQSISLIFSFLYKLISDLQILQELLKNTFI